MERDQLLRDLCANVSARVLNGSIHQTDYEIISSNLAELRLEKCRLYGESRYEEVDQEFDLWMCFSDIHRKYIRLKQLTKLARQGDESALHSLIDAYKDIANYGIMGVQILQKYVTPIEDQD